MFPDRQTPDNNEIFLDHVGWFVPNIAAASEAFERLGFPLTRFTKHMNENPDGSREPSGTANRCAMINKGYLEVLTRVPGVTSAITNQMDACMKRYTGLHLIAFSVADPDFHANRLSESGFIVERPVALRRSMSSDQGEGVEAEFTVIRLRSEQMVEGRIQVLRHETPDIVWQPSLIARKNAAEKLSGIMICVDDINETAERYRRFTNRCSRTVNGGVDIFLDRGIISIRSVEACRSFFPDIKIPSCPFMAATAIQSYDMAITLEFLTKQKIKLRKTSDNCVVVDSAYGAGAAFVFHAQDTAPFTMS